MKDTTKDALIAVLSLYVLMDIGAAYIMTKSHPRALSAFLSAFDNPLYVTYISFCVIVVLCIYGYISGQK